MEYSNPKRENDPYSLPDIEIFQIPEDYQPEPENDEEPYEPGWYWWSCLPGCLPEGDPTGPFETYEEALDDAREGVEE